MTAISVDTMSDLTYIISESNRIIDIRNETCNKLHKHITHGLLQVANTRCSSVNAPYDEKAYSTRRKYLLRKQSIYFSITICGAFYFQRTTKIFTIQYGHGASSLRCSANIITPPVQCPSVPQTAPTSKCKISKKI